MERSPNTYSPITTDQAIDEVTLDRRPGHPAVGRDLSFEAVRDGLCEAGDLVGGESESIACCDNFPTRDCLSLAFSLVRPNCCEGGPHSLRRERHIDVPNAQV